MPDIVFFKEANITGSPLPHSPDELHYCEQGRDETTSALATLDALILAMTQRRDTLPA